MLGFGGLVVVVAYVLIRKTIDGSIGGGGGVAYDPTNDPNSGLKDCARNSACVALGLTGACCPTSEGLVLNCCTADDNVVTPPS